MNKGRFVGWFSNQSLGRQLQAAFAVVLLVLQAASGFTLWTTLTNEQADNRVTHVYEVLDLSQGAVIAANDMEQGYQGFVATGEGAFLERYTAGQRGFRSKITQLRAQTVSPSMLALWADLDTRGSALQHEVLEPAIAARQAADTDTGSGALSADSTLASLGQAIRGFAELRLDFDQAIATERVALDTRTKQSAEASQRMLVVLVGGMVLATGLAGAIAFFLARSIVDAVQHLARAAQRVAEGDLGSRVELRRRDEVGQAAMAFNRMADHLQTTIDQTESILNSAGEGIMGSNSEHGLIFANPAAASMLGYTSTELVGKSVHATVHHSRADGSPYPNESCPVHLTLIDGVTRRITDEVMWRKDGTSFPVDYTCGRLGSRGSDQGRGAVVTFRDVTARKRVEEEQRRSAHDLRRQRTELERSNRELQDFASVASHDLQEPLRKVQAFGDRLHSKYHDQLGEDGRMYLERMQNAAGRMQTLIGDLLVLSRVTTQVRPFVELDLNVLVADVLSDLEVAVERSGAQLHISPLPTVLADEVQMRQLFQNLLSNALKFRQPGVTPRLRVSSQAVEGTNDGVSQGWLEISVTDNGIGFDEKYLDRIFTIFQRLHGRDEYEGTGVGLAVCRKIVDRHGGSITARSALQQGSTFLITLPRTQPATEALYAA
jgi:PAS domain S-box-containing protein